MPFRYFHFRHITYISFRRFIADLRVVLFSLIIIIIISLLYIRLIIMNYLLLENISFVPMHWHIFIISFSSAARFQPWKHYFHLVLITMIISFLQHLSFHFHATLHFITIEVHFTRCRDYSSSFHIIFISMWS